MDVSSSVTSAGIIHLMIPKLFEVRAFVGHCPKQSLTDYTPILFLHYRCHAGASKRCSVPNNFEVIQMVFYNELTHEHIYKNVPARATSCGCV